MHKGLIILAFLYSIKYLNLFLPKGTLLDTTVLSMSTFFIGIGLSWR